VSLSDLLLVLNLTYSSCSYCCSCGELYKNPFSVDSNGIGMKFGRNVLQINSHRLTESDFGFDVTLSRWRPLRDFKRTTNPQLICCGFVVQHNKRGDASERLLC